MNNTTQLVWYVGYGSNLSRERFECYIKGGKPKYSTKTESYPAMRDPTPPIDSCSYHVPYNIYFAKKSPNWGNGGVAFIDDSKPGDTFGRMWLIKKTQYVELRIREGTIWYDKEILLGNKDNIPICTITHNSRYKPEIAPHNGYLKTIVVGLAEIFSEDEVNDYVIELNKMISSI